MRKEGYAAELQSKARGVKPIALVYLDQRSFQTRIQNTTEEIEQYRKYEE